MPNKCLACNLCLSSCQRCPNGCEFVTIYNSNLDRINRQVRMGSSQQLLKKKSKVVSQMVGQSATPHHLKQAGGPGDLISAVQSTGGRINNSFKSLRRVSYNLGSVKNRTAYNGKKGVDRKHDSYARFLARKVGGVLRAEQMPGQYNRKAMVHQPRSRTGFGCGCFSLSKVQTKQHMPKSVRNVLSSTCVTDISNTCCTTRIPQLTACSQGQPCTLSTSDANRWNSGFANVSGAYGNNTQCVSYTSCSCCLKATPPPVQQSSQS